jgi:hypothetical protein
MKSQHLKLPVKAPGELHQLTTVGALNTKLLPSLGSEYYFCFVFTVNN